MQTKVIGCFLGCLESGTWRNPTHLAIRLLSCELARAGLNLYLCGVVCRLSHPKKNGCGFLHYQNKKRDILQCVSEVLLYCLIIKKPLLYILCCTDKCSFSYYQRKASKENMLLEDRISELPHDILVHILSQLKMDEAGRTSILSRRWRYMWTSIVNLDFDASHVLYDLKREIKCLEVERPIYINYVNQVIRNHQAQTIDKFVVVFSLNERSAPDIDRWVSFAARKKVKSLKLVLRNHGGYTELNSYNFPHSVEILRCSSLTSFHLDEINISGELLEILLCNCLNLERVFVSRSTTLVSLNVDGPLPGLKLKWLDLHFCHNIKCLNVCAPNLVSFKYTGPKIPLLLKNVPKLFEMSLTGLFSYYLLTCLSEVSSYLPQLEKLELKSFEVKKHLGDRFPVIPKVKHLALTMVKTDYRSFVDYTSMIKACPSLYKFSFKVVYWDDKFEARETYKVKGCPHNIREVEFIRFCGRMLEVQLAMYLIENAVMLEKMTFYTVHGGPQNGSEPDEAQISASACARQLGKILPPGVELHIV